MRPKTQRGIGLLALFLLFSWLCPGTALWASTPALSPPKVQDFPVFPQIKANVDFWISIFSRYSRSQGVIHDANDLSRVFGVVELDPRETEAAARQNSKVREAAVRDLKALLLRLAQGHPPANQREKRIAALFGNQPNLAAMARTAQTLRIQTGLKEHFREGLIRSGALVPEFRQIFRAHGLPEDLVYLPCVESSFNVNAYSKFGAAGVWQFTRSTGKLYMEVDYVVDERRDPFISAQAAARLLKLNFTVLQDWPLAITAYNHGLNGMKRAKSQHQTYPAVFQHYNSPSFKFASRNFYSEFLAARQVAKNIKDYFGNLTLDTPVSHTRFTTKGFVLAADLSRALNLDLAVIQKMNPALRPPVFEGKKFIPRGFELRLPRTISGERAAAALAGIYRTKQKPSLFHRVGKGDTASAIARTHGISLGELILANGLDKRATIFIGQTLRIPAKGEDRSSATLAAESKVPKTEKKPPVPAPAKAPGTPAPEAAPDQVVAKALPLPAKESLANAPGLNPPPEAKSVPEEQNAPKRTQEMVMARASSPLPAPDRAASPGAAAPDPDPTASSKDAAPDPARSIQPEGPPAGQPPSRLANAEPPVPETVPDPVVAAQDLPQSGAQAAGAAEILQAVTADLKVQTLKSEKGQAVGLIQVAPEETLGHYADWLKVSTRKIRALNRMGLDQAISFGQKIKIPLPPQGSNGFEEQRYEFHQEILEDFFGSFSVTGTGTYEIKSGDTLWDLCANQLDIPLWLLQKYNPRVNFNALKPRQKLTFPQVSPSAPSAAEGNRDFRI